MTYVQGQRAALSTQVTDGQENLVDATVVLTLTAPDGAISTPTVQHVGVGLYTANVTFDQVGDWLVVWSSSGTVITVNTDQVHVIAPALRIISLTEAKEHGNITTSTADRELTDFIGTAQQIIEDLVGPTVPRTATQTWYGPAGTGLLLRTLPVISVTGVTEYGATVDPSLYLLDPDLGQLIRPDRRCWYGSALFPLTVTYRAGRSPIPEAIRWAGKELTISLWRSTQALRGGRGRGDTPDTPTGYALPNRVREALNPFLLAPMVA